MRRELSQAVARLELAINDLYLGSVTEIVREAAVNALVGSWEDHNPQRDEMQDTAFDNTQAFREGWGLFNNDEIQRLDEGAIDSSGIPQGSPVFVNDEAAVGFVERMAVCGSDYHSSALRIHRNVT